MAIEGAPQGWLSDYRAEGSGANSHIGVILVHGFTGSPASMRPFANFLNKKGYRVTVPLIPGHGSRWQDLNKVHYSNWAAKVEKELIELKRECRKVFMVGLSMGGGNSLYVAADHQDKVDGIILVNPMIHIPGIQIKLISIISRLQKSRASVGDDIKKPGVTEWGYDALPLKGVAQLYKYLKLARKRLPSIKTPVLLFHSVDDHVLDVSNTEIILDEIGSSSKQRIELLNSYHVATLDYDADIIFENTRLFIEEISK
ncbi:MAG: alpha/beta fold hydrolase [Actinobacteria bacterium]|nr:alpha/beta fold hydrolase [Actinomycetota bacterium]